MASLEHIVAFCQERLGVAGFPDLPGAMNGLQMANHGEVRRIGAAVDAGMEVFRRAAAAQVNFLIVHHGMFWEAPRPWTGLLYDKLELLTCHDIAVYSAHLPLDAHPELGNNARVARLVRMEPDATFLPYEGRDIGLIARFGDSRKVLRRRLESLFARVTAIEFGGSAPTRVAIVTGSGHTALDGMVAAGVDTLVTGELREHVYVQAQELGLNLYACGHCATEVFGVCALAEEVAKRFSLPWEFIATENPL